MSDAQELIDTLRNIDTDELLRAIATEHPTNQQLLANNVFAIIKQWSDVYEAGNYDLRNKATVEAAHSMFGPFEETIRLPYI